MKNFSIISAEKNFNDFESEIIFVVNDSKNNFPEKVVESAKNFSASVVCVTSKPIDENIFDSVVLVPDENYFLNKISKLIDNPYAINLDFIHIKRFFQNAGKIIAGFGKSEGEIIAATEKAISSFEQKNIFTEILIIFATSEKNFSFDEVNSASILVQESFSENANVIFGVVNDESLENFVEVLILAGEGGNIYESD